MGHDATSDELSPLAAVDHILAKVLAPATDDELLRHYNEHNMCKENHNMGRNESYIAGKE